MLMESLENVAEKRSQSRAGAKMQKVQKWKTKCFPKRRSCFFEKWKNCVHNWFLGHFLLKTKENTKNTSFCIAANSKMHVFRSFETPIGRSRYFLVENIGVLVLHISLNISYWFSAKLKIEALKIEVLRVQFSKCVATRVHNVTKLHYFGKGDLKLSM